jgi:sporulation protein YtfJ
MDKYPVSDFISEAMGKIREITDANTIIGQPIVTADGITLIPVSKVSMGFAGGGSEFQTKNAKAGSRDPYGAGSGAGIKITPVAFVVIKEGSVRIMNIEPPVSTTADRVIELIPDIMDKIDDVVRKLKKDSGSTAAE